MELLTARTGEFEVENGCLKKYRKTDGEVTLVSGIESLADGVFQWSKLTGITLPAGMTTIGASAFSFCRKLKYVRMPQGMTTIGKHAFGGCTALKALVLPDSVTEVGEEAFGGNEWDICGDQCALELMSVSHGVFELLNGKTMPMSGCAPIGLVVREEDAVSFFAFDTQTWGKLIRAGDWATYDAKLAKEVEDASYGLDQWHRLGMLGRLCSGEGLSEENRTNWMQILIKEAKKLIAAAEKLPAPEIIRAMYACEIINSKNKKALEKRLIDSAVPEIAAAVQGTPAPADNRSGAAPKVKRTAKEKKILSAVQGAFSDLKRKDGTTVPAEVAEEALLAYAAQIGKSHAILPEVDEAMSCLTYDSLRDAMETLCGMEIPETPEILPMLCRYGTAQQIKKLLEARRRWDKWNEFGMRGNRAVKMLTNALVLSDTKQAVVWLEKNVGLGGYAQMRGVAVAQIYETHLFDFGFDEQGVRRFELGGVTIEARLSEDIKILLTDLKTGKAVRSIPKKGVEPAVQQAAADALTDMRQNLKKALKIKQEQLWDDYLYGTEYDAESWKKRYNTNPFLRAVARILVWEQDGHSFVLGDGNAVDAEGNLYEVGDAPVRVAHVLELPPEVVEQWRQYFASRGLKQPFEQIWEPRYDPAHIREDHFAGCAIPTEYLLRQKKRGISFTDYGPGARFLYVEGFEALEAKEAAEEDAMEITRIVPGKWNRRMNMTMAYLDKITVFDRVRKDDVSVLSRMEAFSQAQVMACIDIAAKSGAVNVTAALLEYRSSRFGAFAAMEEFTLDF